MAEAEVLPPPPQHPPLAHTHLEAAQEPHNLHSGGDMLQRQRGQSQDELQLPWPPLDIGMGLDGGMPKRMTAEGGWHPSPRPPSARDRVEQVRSRREEEYEQQILQQQQQKQQQQQEQQQQQQRQWQSYAVPFEPLDPISGFSSDRRTRAAYSANTNGYPQRGKPYREEDEQQHRQRLQTAPMDTHMPQRILSRREEQDFQLLHKQRQWQTTDPHIDGREWYAARTPDVMLSRREEEHLQGRWQHSSDRELPSRMNGPDRIASRREEEQQQQWRQQHRRFEFDGAAAYSAPEGWHQDEPLPLPPPLYHDDYDERAPEPTPAYQQQSQWQSGHRDGQSSHAPQHIRDRGKDERRQQQWEEPPQRFDTVRRASQHMGSRREVEDSQWPPAAYGAKSSRPTSRQTGSRYEGAEMPRYQEWQSTSHSVNPRDRSPDAPNSPLVDGWQSKPHHPGPLSERALTSRGLNVPSGWQAAGDRRGATEQVAGQREGKGRHLQWQQSASSPRAPGLSAEPWPKDYSHRVADRYDSRQSLDMPQSGVLPGPHLYVFLVDAFLKQSRHDSVCRMLPSSLLKT